MSLSIDLTGVQAAQTNIDTIGNNISNVSTASFKSSSVHFSDLYTSSLTGAANSGGVPGQGVTAANISQLFTEGSLSQTGNPLDTAITGNGFFQVKTSTGLAYTRDGAFQVDADGYLITHSGAQVIGFAPAPASSTTAINGSLQAIQISTAAITPVATSSLALGVNLPATDTPINTTTTPFSITNANSYNESTSTPINDSLGVTQNLTTFYTQVAGSGTPNQWQTHYELTTSSGTLIASGSGPTLTFNSGGQLTSGNGTISISNLPDGAAALSIAVDYKGSTLSDQAFAVGSVDTDGRSGGQFTGLAIASDGDVIGQYSNGATQSFGHIALAGFANPQGLTPISGNMWQASQASGTPSLGLPSSGGLGQLESGAIEGSNVDLSAELVNLIAAQQAYQANVQGINIEQQNIQRLLQVQ